MKTVITFDETGSGVSIVKIDKETLAPGEMILPEGFDDCLPGRFCLKDGAIQDMYPEMTNEEAIEAIAKELKERRREASAAELGFKLSSLEDAKRYQLSRIRKRFELIIQEIRGAAAPYEVETWAVQRDEYARWLVDKSAATPYVDGLCLGREVSKEELMPKIGARVTALASVQGQQHAIEKLVEAAQTPEEALAVPIPGESA